jgi:formate dehydrogenase iron-sulfur subunit
MKAMLVDVSTCIGCRACQVACKEWNGLPSEAAPFTGGYESPGGLSGDTWKQVKFLEGHGPSGPTWEFYSDSCKHCTEAPCLDACPTGAIYKDENGFVLVAEEVCNGNAHCVPACPFHVIDVSRSRKVAQKCTFCHDRVAEGHQTACAKVCPTDCIRFDERDVLVAHGQARVERLRGAGRGDASLYGEDVLGGLRVLYVLPSAPDVYGLPDPKTVERPVHRLGKAWLAVGATAAAWAAIVSTAFLWFR